MSVNGELVLLPFTMYFESFALGLDACEENCPSPSYVQVHWVFLWGLALTVFFSTFTYLSTERLLFSLFLALSRWNHKKNVSKLLLIHCLYFIPLLRYGG